MRLFIAPLPVIDHTPPVDALHRLYFLELAFELRGNLMIVILSKSQRIVESQGEFLQLRVLIRGGTVAVLVHLYVELVALVEGLRDVQGVLI